MAGGNIVAEWLRSLHLGQYAESFIDNGYDDLEICKQVGDPDLDAIGVFNPLHRSRLLQSVKTLREEGAASVYFTLEETAAVHEECLCDNVSARSSRTSSGRCSDKEVAAAAAARHLGSTSPGASSSAESAQELTKYLDEYEEGKAELVKIPRIQLKLLLRDKLTQDGIRLSCQPYSTSVCNLSSRSLSLSLLTLYLFVCFCWCSLFYLFHSLCGIIYHACCLCAFCFIHVKNRILPVNLTSKMITCLFVIHTVYQYFFII